MAIIITDQASTIKFDLGNSEEYHIDKDGLSIKKKFGQIYVHGSAVGNDKFTKLRFKYSDVSSPAEISNTALIATILGYKASAGFVVGDVRITDGVEVLDIKANVHTGNGEALVNLEGHVCQGNTSIIPLGISAEFTGEWKDNIDYGSIIIGIIADQPSITNGLLIEWSSDGVTAHDVDTYTISANIGKTFSFQPVRRYFRVRYINDGVIQTFFNLETSLRRYYIKPSSHRIQDSIIGEDDAELVKSVLTGLAPDGTFKNVLVTNQGNQKISIEEFETNVSTTDKTRLRVSSISFAQNITQGGIPDHWTLNKFGQNEDIGTGAFEDIWDGGGTYPYPPDSTAPITHIYSTVAGDTQDVEVQGLDITGLLVIQTITLTGTVVAPLTTALWRVFRLKNEGTTNNAGIIHASDSGKVVSYAQIGIGNNQTLMALWTVPLGMSAGMLTLDASMAGLTSAYSLDGHLRMRKFGKVFQIKRTFGLQSTGTSAYTKKYEVPISISALTDIKVEAISSKAAGVMNASFSIIYKTI